MQSQRPRFQYSLLLNPSTDIRLAIIEPGAEEDDIRCRILQGNIENIGNYEALSYAWGDATNRVPIILDDKTFEVTPNLESALRNLRNPGSDPGQTRAFWIDAICIDQENDEERSAQVQRMRSIYQLATRVVIWVGRNYEPEDDQIKYDKDLWGFDSLDGDFSELTRDAFKLVQTLYKNLLYMPNELLQSSASWGQLARIAQRAWFTRLWVIQEVKVAKHAIIMCGRCTIDWREMEMASLVIAVLLRNDARDGTKILKFLREVNMGAVIRVSLYNTDFSNLLCVLNDTKGAKATDPRDLLFAISGITDGEDSTEIEVDYSKDPDTVYRNWATRRIQRRGNLDVLSVCEDTGRMESENGNAFPSWVPNLKELWGTDNALFNLTHGYGPATENRRYAASGRSSSSVTFSADGLEILLSGLHLDSIVLLCCACKVKGNGDVDDFTSQILATIDSWEATLTEHFATKLPHEAPWYPNFLDLLFRGYKVYCESTSIPLQERYSIWRGHTPGLSASKSAQWSIQFNSMEFVLFVMVNLSQLFVTANGHLGIIASRCNAQVGDEVHILFGGGTPFVLRRQESNNSLEKRYRLMGPCYLSGFMHGEALDLPDITRQEITIA